MTSSRAEALLASAAATLAAAVLVAYVPYQLGWRVVPGIVLTIAVGAGLALCISMLRRCRPTAEDWAPLATAAIVGAVLLWRSRPDLLPIGGGPDLAHHLVLVNYISRAWRLVDDPALYPYLGDMMDYTPGSHLLIALAASAARTDALRTAQPVLVFATALKAGLVACVTLRTITDGPARAAITMAAAALLFVPHAFFTGSFTEHSYWAQVVSELFACAAWWAIVAWRDERSDAAAALFALFGTATFVTWPIWIGPIVLVAAGIVLAGDADARTKARTVAITVLPIAAIALFHANRRLGRLQMVATSGAVTRPSVDTLGWAFIVVALAGLIASGFFRRARHIVLFTAAIALQAAALWYTASRAGADAPYMALKMMYLAIYPLAAGGAVALAAVVAALPGSARQPFTAAIIIALSATATFRWTRTPHAQPVVTLSAWRAGLWARDHLDRACVDYLVADGYTGYWLHLAVLDNPRDTPRFNDPDTFDPQKALARWVEVEGLPFAIVDDEAHFSKALFDGTDTIARYGRSIVIKRHGSPTCPSR